MHDPAAVFAPDRHERLPVRRCGRSGLQLPCLALGGWRTVGGYEAPRQARDLFFSAFDRGIFHFDFANNYGNPEGMAEAVAGGFLHELPRHEIVISSKAGYRMWPGPHGDGGSRKYLIQSCEASLRRLRLDHVDLFYHHRPDPETPLEESLGALNSLVEQGKALYVGLSNYPGELAARAVAICRERGWAVPIVNQVRYSLTARGIEQDLLPRSTELGLGVVAFSPLDRGSLTTKYLDGWRGSRAASTHPHDQGIKRFLDDPAYEPRIRRLAAIAAARGQELPSMALAWCLRDPRVTSVLTAASSPDQLDGILQAAASAPFSADELRAIEGALTGA
jgi:L-glyceraldehyde 3-phosphate reductase